MRVAIIGIGVALISSCTPDFAANGAQRCEDDEACGAESVCYRGFCLSDPSDPVVAEALDAAAARAAEEERSPAKAADAGVSASPSSAEPEGASAPSAAPTGTSSATDTSRSTDASTATAAPNAPAATTSPSPSAGGNGGTGNTGTGNTGTGNTGTGNTGTGNTGNGPKPGSGSSSGPGPAGSVDASMPAAVDAGAPAPVDANAAEPALPGNCTLEECCAEALGPKPAEQSDDKGPKGVKKSKCGCDDPALLRTLTCGVLAPLGAIL